MKKNFFVDAHSSDWSDIAMDMTVEYFVWMNLQIQNTCNFSIEEITGMSLSDYISSAMDVIVPKSQDHAAFFLLVVDGSAVAMGGIRALPSGHAEIVRVYTKPEYRGLGYGRMILDKLILEAKSQDFKMLNLDTGIFMTNAQSMYKSYGSKYCKPYDGAEPPLQLLPYWLFMQLELK